MRNSSQIIPETEKYKFYNPVKSKEYHKIIFGLKSICLVLILAVASFFGYQAQKQRDSKSDPSILYGIWETKVFIKNNDTIAPLITDSRRWRYLISERKGTATVKSMTDKRTRYIFEIDSTTSRISMYQSDSKKDSLNLVYRQSEKNILELHGILECDSIHLYLSKVPLDKFPLTSRGFHWINESPFNN